MTLAATTAGPEGALAAPPPGRRARGGYGRYASGKVLGSLGSLAFVLVVNFFLFRVLPGDPPAPWAGAASARPSSSSSSTRPTGSTSRCPSSS